MLQKVFFIKLLLVHYASQIPAETRANCNEDVPLMCPDVDTDTMDFISVTWYKLHDQRKHGIIRRGKGDNSTLYYNFTRNAWFGEKYSLLLPRVTPEDSGSYECAINANVGGRNLNLEVNLIVNVCVTQANPTTTTNVLNGSSSDQLGHSQAEELPVTWSIIGYVAVGLAKVLLSLMGISVIRRVGFRPSRRRQYYW